MIILSAVLTKTQIYVKTGLPEFIVGVHVQLQHIFWPWGMNITWKKPEVQLLFLRVTVLCKKENQKSLYIHKRNWQSNNALLWEEWFMVCKTWCCFIWTECCCKNVYFSMDTLVRPNGGETLCLTMTTQLSSPLSFVLLLLIIIDWRMLSSSSSRILFFSVCLLLSPPLRIFHRVVVCGLETHLESECFTDHLQKCFSTLDHNLFSVLLDCIYTCTFMCVWAVPL